MTLVTPPVITAWLDVSGTLTETDITEYCSDVTITRGRTSQFGEIPAGTATISAYNYTRLLDPSHTLSPFYGRLIPGTKVKVQVLNAGVFIGQVQDWDYSYEVDGVSTLSITIIDYLATLARKTLPYVTPAWSETVGERIENLLALPEVDMLANAQVMEGVSTLQADIIEDGTNALAYMQLLARTDLGRLYAAADSQAIVFRDRTFIGDPSVYPDGLIVVLSDAYGVNDDDIPYIPFAEVDVNYGSDVLYTQVIVSRVDGSTETFTDTDAADVYGIQSTGSEYTGLLLEDDTQSYDLGLLLIGVYAEPVQQFSRFMIHMERLNYAQTNIVTYIEIGFVIRGIFTPDGIGAPIDQYCVVEGIRHVISPGRHEVELFVSKSLVQEFD